MVDLETWIRLVAGVLLLLSNGFFVTTEFALTRVRQFPESEFQGRGLELAWRMTERLEIYLSGCQVGITISSIGLGVVAEPATAAVLDELFGVLGYSAGHGAGHSALAIGVGFGLINLLHVIVGEQAPTYLGIERTKLVAKYGAPLLYGWTKLMSPVILLADRVAKGLLGLFGVEIGRSWTEEELEEGEEMTRGELRRQMGDAMAQIDLPEERREEVISALDIDQITVGDIMIDRDAIVPVRATEDVETNLDRMAAQPHGRFPIVGGSFETFEGILYTPAVLRHADALAEGAIDFLEIAAPPLTVRADLPVADLIDEFQAENQELALVEDDGEIVGLVTATDAFEEITGELEDPIDLENGLEEADGA